MRCDSHFTLTLINTAVSVIFTLLMVWNILHLFSTGEKPFECKLCHQRSRDYSAMIKHLRTHNGASPYQCTICQEYCPSLSSMQKHMKAHKPEDVPPDWRIEKTYLYLCYVWDRATNRNGESGKMRPGTIHLKVCFWSRPKTARACGQTDEMWCGFFWRFVCDMHLCTFLGCNCTHKCFWNGNVICDKGMWIFRKC